MQTELGETQTSLKDVQSGSEDAGKGLDEMGNEAEKTGGQAEGLKSVMSGLSTGIGVAVGALTAAAVAVVAVGAAIGGLVFSSANAAGALVDMSAKTGISVVNLQEMSFIGKQLGVDLETMTGANAKLIRSMDAAQTKSSDQAKAFKALGIATKDSDGNLRDSKQVFNEVIDALGKIENPTQRDLMAMQLFGKSAQELNPLIKAGSGELTNMAEQANHMGAVMGEETVAKLDKFGDTVDGMKAGLMGTLGTLAGAFLPGFQGIFDQLGGYLQLFSGVVRGSNGDLGRIADGLTGLVGKIAGDIAAQAPALLQAGMNILMSILNGILANLPVILTAVISIIKSLVGFIIQAAPVLLTAGLQLLMTLIQALIENLPMLIEAALQMIITLVMGIAQALPTLIPAVIEMLITIVNTLVENLPMLIQAALQLILALVQGLAAALPVLIQAIPKIIQAIIDTLTSDAMINMIVEAAPAIIIALINGLLTALPMLVEAIWQILTAIWTLMTSPEVDAKLRAAGKAILDGIWAGIKDNVGTFMDKIKAFALSIWAKIKETLGIKSPSQLFADTVGEMIPAGIWAGIEAGLPDLQRQLSGAMLGLNANLAVGGNGLAYAGAGAVTNDYSRQNQYTINNAGIDAAELVRIQRREDMLYGS
jgi:phage-related protein